jgi:hypothetical protein
VGAGFEVRGAGGTGNTEHTDVSQNDTEGVIFVKENLCFLIHSELPVTTVLS